MAGLVDLKEILASMNPVVDAVDCVFVTMQGTAYLDLTLLDPVASIMEAEGMSLIVPKVNADDAGLVYEGVYRKITLRVHSALDSVGLTAAVATALANKGISANVVAGYYHDHIFVPVSSSREAMEVLHELASKQ